MTSNFNLNWSLLGPRGQEVATTNIGSDAMTPFTIVVPGTYQLRITGSGSSTGSYTFSLNDLASATPLSLNTPTTGTLNPGNTLALYNFSARQGDHFFVDLTNPSSTSSAVWRLIDPFGKQVTQTSSLADLNVPSLPVSGTYTLLLAGSVSITTPLSYTFTATKIIDTTQALAPGATASGTVQPFQKKNYTFTLANATQILINNLVPFTGGFTVSLMGAVQAAGLRHHSLAEGPARGRPAIARCARSGIGRPLRLRRRRPGRSPAPIYSVQLQHRGRRDHDDPR
jgi:hypothetical protein